MTHEELIKIIPAYIGCTVVNAHGERGTVDEITDQGKQITMYEAVHSYPKVGEFKLVLRSFDQKTDEESARFRELADEADKHSYSLWSKWATKAVNYLRSIGVDCDGLIEAGYAIREGSANASASESTDPESH